MDDSVYVDVGCSTPDQNAFSEEPPDAEIYEIFVRFLIEIHNAS